MNYTKSFITLGLHTMKIDPIEFECLNNSVLVINRLPYCCRT
jgi:hypothetical protein